ncbi:hypothetical protein [Neobacillus dielmonensis]|uniref:hypothetical protein n=1 Tax=Neobacillus dielmonensis TaxID=1347369 RepID=UPI0005A906D2|nr:hypothetical protein [Neobacillus dielmonensis]
MFSFESDALLVDDREDLIAVLQMRFGRMAAEVIEHIYGIGDYHTLQRLILAAANAASWEIFEEELQASNHSFRLIGEEFNPLRDQVKGWERRDGEKKK